MAATDTSTIGLRFAIPSPQPGRSQSVPILPPIKTDYYRPSSLPLRLDYTKTTTEEIKLPPVQSEHTRRAVDIGVQVGQVSLSQTQGTMTDQKELRNQYTMTLPANFNTKERWTMTSAHLPKRNEKEHERKHGKHVPSVLPTVMQPYIIAER